MPATPTAARGVLTSQFRDTRAAGCAASAAHARWGNRVKERGSEHASAPDCAAEGKKLSESPQKRHMSKRLLPQWPSRGLLHFYFFLCLWVCSGSPGKLQPLSTQSCLQESLMNERKPYSRHSVLIISPHKSGSTNKKHFYCVTHAHYCLLFKAAIRRVFAQQTQNQCSGSNSEQVFRDINHDHHEPQHHLRC